MAAAVPFIGYSAIAGASMLGLETFLACKWGRRAYNITKMAIVILGMVGSGILLFSSVAALGSLTSSLGYLTLGTTGTLLALGGFQFLLSYLYTTLHAPSWS